MPEPRRRVAFSVLGFRRFSLTGLAKVSLEWTLVMLAYRLKCLHLLGAPLTPA